jgi:RNA polymerase sigma-70 factor (ECF subfamily)
MNFEMVNRMLVLHNEDDNECRQAAVPRGVIPFMTTDEQAMWRVRMHHDESAFAMLVGRWREVIWRLCLRMVGDAHRAEDITQEVFLRLFLHRGAYRIEAKFSTYLWRIAINLCQDELRRVSRRRESPIEDPEAAETRPSPESLHSAASCRPDVQTEASEQAAQVREAMALLAEPYRLVLVLRHYENLKFREIADVLEIPEGTVKSRMSEALSRMADLLSHLAPGARPDSETPPTKPASATSNAPGLFRE